MVHLIALVRHLLCPGPSCLYLLLMSRIAVALVKAVCDVRCLLVEPVRQLCGVVRPIRPVERELLG